MDAEQTTATHAYCTNCKAIEPATFEVLSGLSFNGLYLGGDITCRNCRVVIATVYKELKK